ncbi:MAG TPA: hypothetical protein VFG47_19125, partial [Geminicoccaceae bacterium]|nr:hypothetical protein [Geminicoccaceae bacterium]
MLDRWLGRASARLGLVVRGLFRTTSGHDRHTCPPSCAGSRPRGVAVRLVDLPHRAPSKLPAEARDPCSRRAVSRRTG